MAPCTTTARTTKANSATSPGLPTIVYPFAPTPGRTRSMNLPGAARKVEATFDPLRHVLATPTSYLTQATGVLVSSFDVGRRPRYHFRQEARPMPRPVTLGPLSQMALGFTLCFATVGVVACASLPDLQCQAVAVQRVLGKNPDPDQVTVGDVRDLATRFKACAAQDAGR